METIFLIINRIMPIILLLLIGKWMHLKSFVSATAITDIKKLVVNLALPAALFLSFLTLEIKPAYFWFVPLLIIIETLLFILGSVLKNKLSTRAEYFPFLITGFEYGMIGVSLFAAAYGIEQLGKIAIIDFGQELFVWFIYMALLTRKREGSTNISDLLKMFITSPVIIAILSGIGLNLAGVPKFLPDLPFAAGILNTLELVAALTIPLILFVVGYGIQLDRDEFKFSLRVIAIRLSILIPTALLINHFFISQFLRLDAGFQSAFFTLLILPPPFILTLFMDQSLTQERHRIDNTLTLHTIVTLIVFVIYYAFNPVI